MSARNGSTNQTLAAIQRLVDGIEELDAAIRTDRDLPTAEREVDGGIRFKLRRHLTEASIPVERLRREWTECLAEMQRIEQEADAFQQALGEGTEVASA